VGARAIEPALAKLLAAVVAVSMAFTPLAMALYERLVLARPDGPLAEPEATPFDEGDPQVIVAGFGRFGQIIARLLIANDVRVVTLDSSIEQIELLRRFGRKVHYGDASRMDLLRTAGAEKAQLLVIAIDDKDKAVEMIQGVRETFPHLHILARAWDRVHAYQLLKTGAHEIERETFEGGLAAGQKALRAMGFGARRAAKAAALFRKHDLATFEAIAPLWGEERYVMASRETSETMERLLRADIERMAEDDEEEEEEPRLPVG
jgi:voltage-gated potassium channel Kch